MTSRFRFALLAVAAIAWAASAGAAELVHNPVLSAPAGEDLQITANLVGADGDTRVRLYYRPRGVEIFRSVEMGGTQSDLVGVIPGDNVGIEGLDYYIEASEIKNGVKTVVGTSPASNPTLNPNQVVVRKDVTGPEITPLTPLDGDVLDQARPVISASYADADSGVDAKTAMVKIDGEAVDAGSVQAFDSLVTYVPTQDLKDGEHEIVVAVKDNAGNASSVQWKVTIAATATSKMTTKKSNAWVWDGRLSAETDYGASLSQNDPAASLPYRPYGYNSARLQVNGHGVDDTVKVDITKTDAERSDQQPVDRYLATWQNREGIIGLGDFSPSFSELSLYDLYQLRGVTMDLRSGPINEGHTRLVGVWGQTQRAIEQGATAFNGVPANATYAQYLYGARWEFGNPYFLLGTNAVTINDDKSSVSNPGTTLPYYNTLLTSDVTIGLPILFLSLNGEVGTDMDSDPSLLGATLGNAYKAGLDWNIKPWASRLKFEFRDLGGNYGSFIPVGGGYTTMANPGLVPDYRGYESSFSQMLFQGQFSLDLGLNHWHDNLQGLKPATTTTDFFSVNTNIAPQGLPYLLLGYTQSVAANDADGNTGSGLSGLTGTTETLPNYKTNGKTSTFNVGLGANKAFDPKTTGSLSLNYFRQDYVDQSPQRQSQDLGGNNFVLSGFASVGLSSFNASVGIGNTSQPGYDDAATGSTLTAAPKTGNNFNASVRWNQQWRRNVLDSFLGWDLTDSTTDSQAVTYPGLPPFLDTDVAIVRNSFNIGGGWNFAPKQRVSTAFSLALVGTDTTTAGTSVNSSLIQLYSSLKYELTF
jgi:hypothetical protein